jgi:hypothetical protein
MTKAHNLDWKKYEAIAKYIYETLGRQSGVKIKGYRSNCKVTGKSGVAHQIDILATHSEGIHEYLTAIECKYWKEKISKDIVMKVSAIIEDVNINKGVIVSRSGFTQDGIEYAKHKNIGLVELSEIEEEDLEGKSIKFDVGVLEVHTKCIIHRPEILNIEIDSVEKIQIEKESWKNRTIVRLLNGSQVPFTNYIKEFQNELHLQDKVWQTITKRYEIPGGRLINGQTNSSVNINEVTFTGILMKIDKSPNLRFTLIDQVWLIMKSLFERRTFTFSENGIIIEK